MLILTSFSSLWGGGRPRVGNAAAIDIGSNAVRLMIGTIGSRGRVKCERKCREPIRLGQDVFRDGEISKESFKKTLAAFRKFEKLSREYGVKNIRAVATSAVREASNGHWICNEVYRKTGIPIDVIDYQEEARLIQLAVNSTAALAEDHALLIDIGGGSVEFSYSNKGSVEQVSSIPMGTVRLLQMSQGKEKQLKEIVDTFRPKIRYLKASFNGPVNICFGTGGNFECLGILRTTLLDKKSSEVAKLRDLPKVIDKLLAMSLSQRVEKLSLRQDRADVIVPATLSVKMLMEEFSLQEIRLPRVGLREGLLISLSAAQAA